MTRYSNVQHPHMNYRQCWAVFQTLRFDFRPPPPMVVHFFQSDTSRGSTFSRRMSADRVLCQVLFDLQTGTVRSTTNKVNTLIGIVFFSTHPCYLSCIVPLGLHPQLPLHVGISQFGAGLSLVHGTPHIHLTIFISVISIFDSSSNVSHPQARHRHVWPLGH